MFYIGFVRRVLWAILPQRYTSHVLDWTAEREGGRLIAAGSRGIGYGWVSRRAPKGGD